MSSVELSAVTVPAPFTFAASIFTELPETAVCTSMSPVPASSFSAPSASTVPASIPTPVIVVAAEDLTSVAVTLPRAVTVTSPLVA